MLYFMNPWICRRTARYVVLLNTLLLRYAVLYICRLFWFCLTTPCLHTFIDCGSCYVINMGSVLGIIASDVILTIFIAISVFCFATHQKRKREWDSHDGKRSLPSSISKKMATEVTESPYQELHGVQSDVYSELQHFRK
ncbi:hypothetical protein L3Q82_013142 [Scortum barcoo]|uniref:Uncharacterized protein n=1 Tax=Scortum barcoo TaxID=214431 RepID=A0ACB8VYZ6_9TELE|nr:hypothetical protein L3Q82_013142 [Scortum barcoo]